MNGLGNENLKLLLGEDGAPRDRIVGFETEYSLACRAENPNDNERVNMQVLYFAEAGNTNQFRETGERIYVDVGNHPEYSTPEETSFLCAAHRMLAGHVKMAKIYQAGGEVAFEKAGTPGYSCKPKTVSLLANTTDASHNSWGSHENLLARRDLEPPQYIDALAAHHVSRIVWSGAGHVQPTAASKDTFNFVLSEKADQIWAIANDSTTSSRPLVNLRERSYADDSLYRRVHMVTGETVFSPVANALRLAASSIILRACEVGIRFDDLLPENPIKAIRQISGDTTLTQTVELATGRHYSGLDLQEAIAQRALDGALATENLSEQELEWGIKWLQLLDDLRSDPTQCADRVDWIVKKSLIDRELEAKADSSVSKYALALQKSVDYHRLLPGEGIGMKLLRKGFFQESPSDEILDNGMPLPETRAGLRGRTIASLKAAGQEYMAFWDRLHVEGIIESIRLKDPYAAEDERIDDLLRNLEDMRYRRPLYQYK